MGSRTMRNSSARASRGRGGPQVNTIAAALRPDFPQIRVSTMASATEPATYLIRVKTTDERDTIFDTLKP